MNVIGDPKSNRLASRVMALAVVAAAMLLATACGSDSDSADQDTRVVSLGTGDDTAKRGGTYRLGTPDLSADVGTLDSLDYSAALVEINLLLRTLVTYRHQEGPGARELVPDLAESLPKVSDDGLTYTFELKDGVHFGPPVDREITSRDVEYAFSRLASKELAAPYSFYYEVIEGFELRDGPPRPISGIETPDDKTIIFHLRETTPDFVTRLYLPATAPVPKEVAGCFSAFGDYGRSLVASGAYMIEGSEDADASSCETLEPFSGFEPGKSLRLVRNPKYDPNTDDPEIRDALPDGFEWVVNTNKKDIFAQIEAGQLEGTLYGGPPRDVLRKYATSSELRDRLQVRETDGAKYVTLNVTQPPFDDVNVRRAVQYVLDKAAIQRAWGGETAGPIQHHFAPDALLGDQLENYNPYPSADDAGDVEAAKEEMKQSKYDENQDGVCDAPECEEVLHITSPTEPYASVTPIVEDSLAKIGINVLTREPQNAADVLTTPAKAPALQSFIGWGKDYDDPVTYFDPVLSSSAIVPVASYNLSLVGITAEIAKEVGVGELPASIPSVDKDIERCKAQSGDERIACWADLDKRVMEEVASWVPTISNNRIHVLGPTVTQWAWDPATSNGEVGLAHVAVDPSKQE